MATSTDKSSRGAWIGVQWVMLGVSLAVLGVLAANKEWFDVLNRDLPRGLPGLYQGDYPGERAAETTLYVCVVLLCFCFPAVWLSMRAATSRSLLADALLLPDAYALRMRLLFPRQPLKLWAATMLGITAMSIIVDARYSEISLMLFLVWNLAFGTAALLLLDRAALIKSVPPEAATVASAIITALLLVDTFSALPCCYFNFVALPVCVSVLWRWIVVKVREPFAG